MTVQGQRDSADGGAAGAGTPGRDDARGEPGPGTHERLLSTAFRLFHEQGYHATGVATILREADVHAGSLYHFYPGKQALLVGVLEYALMAMRGIVMAPAEAATPDPIERVFALLGWYRANMSAWGCKLGCPIGNLALELSDNDPQVRALIDANFRNWAEHVRGWLDEAGDELPPSVNRQQLAYFVLTVMEGGIMQARAAGDIARFDDSVAQLRAYFDSLRALAAGGASSHRTRRGTGGAPRSGRGERRRDG